ncbi:MAG: histidinol dehydrogenase [Candidatus Saccharibacteria bacterium]
MIKRFEGNTEEFKSFINQAMIDMEKAVKTVEDIRDLILGKGDHGIVELGAKFDGANLSADSLKVTWAEIEEAYEKVDEGYLEALAEAIANIEDFHYKQLSTSWMEPDDFGNIVGQVHRPLERVGIYVPGGTAAYPSSVLMNAIPAQVAGVREIAMVTPPAADGTLNPYTLVAAAELGIEEIYKVGGAQAIFALAYGTKSIPKVDKITGPGNMWVTLAKRMVYGQVDIDMLAGPSEILIVADENADPAYIAADMMSQAEHDVKARSFVVTTSRELVDKVEKELEAQIQTLSRQSIISEALDNYGAFIIVDNLVDAFAVANEVAPEHLEVIVEEPFSWLSYIQHAGAIFLGQYTPEPVGDYMAGPNHILPTGGTARFYSPVTVDTFMKKSSLIYYSKNGFAQYRDSIIKLAEVEGLTAHANSIKVRKGF